MPTYTGAASDPDFMTWGDDFAPTQDQTGKWTANWSFQCRADKIRAKTPLPGAACTFPGFGFLRFIKASGKLLGGGLAAVACTFEGFDLNAEYDPENESGTPPIGARYRRQFSVAEDPLETNPYYEDVSADDLRKISLIRRGDATIDKNGNYVLKEPGGKETVLSLSAGAATKLLEKLLRGRETYYSPRQRWTMEWTAPVGLTAGQVAAFGKIVNPPGSPATPSGRDWLFDEATEEGPAGGPFNIAVSFLLSGDGGWDEDEYSA